MKSDFIRIRVSLCEKQTQPDVGAGRWGEGDWTAVSQMIHLLVRIPFLCFERNGRWEETGEEWSRREKGNGRMTLSAHSMKLFGVFVCVCVFVLWPMLQISYRLLCRSPVKISWLKFRGAQKLNKAS